jgi:hypothetical protein
MPHCSTKPSNGPQSQEMPRSQIASEPAFSNQLLNLGHRRAHPLHLKHRTWSLSTPWEQIQSMMLISPSAPFTIIRPDVDKRVAGQSAQEEVVSTIVLSVIVNVRNCKTQGALFSEVI